MFLTSRSEVSVDVLHFVNYINRTRSILIAEACSSIIASKWLIAGILGDEYNMIQVLKIRRVLLNSTLMNRLFALTRAKNLEIIS